MSRAQKLVSWAAQLVAAVILLQTLFFKFSGSPESVHIFTRLGVEPWGRIASGIAELAAGLLLLVPSTAALGALLGLGLMAGAIGSHLTVLGIEILGDGGLLFGLAWAVAISSGVVLYLRRASLPIIGSRFD